MKTRYIVYFILSCVSIALFSCSTPYSVSTNPRLVSDWRVTSIQLEGDVAGMEIPTPVFNDAPISCLATSKWMLYEGGSGSYTVPPGGDTAICAIGVRKINWEVVNLGKDAHYFQFYRYMAPKGILTDRFTTFMMQIASLTKNTMVLKYPIKYQEKTGDLVFTFSK